MFEPPIPSETVASDQSPPAATRRPCDLIVGGIPFWCDGDPTAFTGSYKVTAAEFEPFTPPATNLFDGIDSDELTEAALSLAALEAGVRVQQLKLLAELDARDAWKADGQTGMVAWMGLQFGTRTHTARQMIGPPWGSGGPRGCGRRGWPASSENETVIDVGSPDAGAPSTRSTTSTNGTPTSAKPTHPTGWEGATRITIWCTKAAGK